MLSSNNTTTISTTIATTSIVNSTIRLINDTS